eukprot:CAMPEP_0171376594 /NCGR_PEP_ID=MMETSP0879-20121228/19043_1 /TAXON_ID=67004 /ORGANISM="Thalassiosira weissflogii, Strain CCMP1336" /LENGTH=892 /DNA_ID=CAMNT_0011886475 /DNA_START=25 /DNA_END=2703 /DNA_ORIENTATION=+
MGASASKIKFRESLTSLISRDVSPDDAEFWDELWKIPSSAEEVFELLPPANARRLRDERFDNLATLFTQATAQLCQIVETPYTIYFDQALNCVRVLTRILPFLLEKGDLGDNDPNVEALCWGSGAADGTKGRGKGRKRGDSRDEDDDTKDETEEEEEDDVDDEIEEDDNQEPLALLVVHAAMHMLFLPQFTCDFYEEDGPPDDALDPYASSSSESDSDNEDLDDGNDETHDKEAERRRRMERDDREIQIEAGLGKPRRVRKGVRLTPRPAGIVWAPGVGFSPDGKCHITMNNGNNNISMAKGPTNPNAKGGKKGSASNTNVNNPEAAYTRKYDKNRIEVLRLLLAACCDPLFSPADEYNPLASRWMAVAVAADAPNAPCLFYSLLNTVISFDPSNSSFGGVPYSNKFASDTHVKLVELSAQVLCVLLDCGLSGDPVPCVNRYDEPVVRVSYAYKNGFNIFRVMLARINSGKDLATLYRGFVRLLRNTFESKNTLLPSSQSRLECYQELLILLWKTLEENPLFLDFILTRCDVCELVVPLCYLMYTSRKDSAQVGLVHICTFILLKLSGERSFGVSLNRPFRTKLPCDLPLFSGSHADLISITLHKIIVNGSYRLVSLYSCFLTIVSNFSPYWRSMSLVSSVKLVNLFELFSSPKFLYSGEKAYRHLALLLEIFNNIIQYQYNGNQHLVYAIVRRKDSFGRLASLTLPKAIHQCQKQFPSSERPEYDADAADAAQVAALSIQDVDEHGNPIDDEDDATSTTNGRDTATSSTTVSGTGECFVPTEAWLTELRASLPLETVSRLLQHLVPVVDDMCDRKNGVVDEIEILEVFKDITMVGLLPVPHAIVIRKYQPNQYTSIWFTAFMWGVVFLRSQKPPIFDGQCIELFQVAGEDK